MKPMDYGLQPLDLQNLAPATAWLESAFSRCNRAMTSLASGFAMASSLLPLTRCAAALSSRAAVLGWLPVANVRHGFNADHWPTYDKAAATDAQKLTTDGLKERGV